MSSRDYSDWNGYDAQDEYKSNNRAGDQESLLLRPRREVVMGNAVVVYWTTELLATTLTNSSEDCSHRKVTSNVISLWVVGGYGSV